MTTYAHLPGQDEPVQYSEPKYVSEQIFKIEEDAELDIESKEGFERKQDIDIFRKCDKCGVNDGDGEPELHTVRSLGSEAVTSAHLCSECLGDLTEVVD